VVEACAAGRFRIFAVSHADDALELLSGLPTGEPDAEGNLPEGCLTVLVMRRLAEFFALRREYATPMQVVSRAGEAEEEDGEGGEPPTPPSEQV